MKIYKNLVLLRLKMKINNLKILIMQIRIQIYKIYPKLSCRWLVIRQSDRIMITRLWLLPAKAWISTKFLVNNALHAH